MDFTKCLLAVFTCISMPIHSYADTDVSSEDAKYSKESCQSLDKVNDHLTDYVETWINPYDFVPAPPEEKLAQISVKVANADLVQCILDFSFVHEGNYLTTLYHVKELLLRHEHDPQYVQSLFALLVRFNDRWEQVMLSRKVLRQRGRNFNQILVGLGLVGAMAAGRIHIKNITKLGRLIKNFLGKPSGSHIVKALTGISSKPAAVRSGAIGIVGVSESGGEYGQYKEDMQAKEDAGNKNAPIFTSRTGDQDRKVWASPFFVVDLAVDHNNNELTDFETYELFRDLSSLTVGTIGGIYVTSVASKYLETRFPIATRTKEFLRTSSKLPAALRAGRGASILAGGLQGLAGLAIGLGSYKIIDIGVRQSTDWNWNVQSENSLATSRARLLFGQPEYWNDYHTNRVRFINRNDRNKYTRQKAAHNYWNSTLNDKVIGWHTDYQPVLQNSPFSSHQETLVSGALIDTANTYMYRTLQRSDYFRGNIAAKYQELILSYVDKYLCTGLTYKRYEKDNKDRKTGHNFTDGRLQVSDERALELSQLGDEKLKELEDDFKIKIKEFVEKYKSHPDLLESVAVYDQASHVLSLAQEASGRYFLQEFQEQIALAKERDIYNLSESMIWDRAKIASGLTLSRFLLDKEDRSENICVAGYFKSKLENLNQKVHKLIKGEIK